LTAGLSFYVCTPEHFALAVCVALRHYSRFLSLVGSRLRLPAHSRIHASHLALLALVRSLPTHFVHARSRRSAPLHSTSAFSLRLHAHVFICAHALAHARACRTFTGSLHSSPHVAHFLYSSTRILFGFILRFALVAVYCKHFMVFTAFTWLTQSFAVRLFTHVLVTVSSRTPLPVYHAFTSPLTLMRAAWFAHVLVALSRLRSFTFHLRLAPTRCYVGLVHVSCLPGFLQTRSRTLRLHIHTLRHGSHTVLHTVLPAYIRSWVYVHYTSTILRFVGSSAPTHVQFSFTALLLGSHFAVTRSFLAFRRWSCYCCALDSTSFSDEKFLRCLRLRCRTPLHLARSRLPPHGLRVPRLRLCLYLVHHGCCALRFCPFLIWIRLHDSLHRSRLLHVPAVVTFAHSRLRTTFCFTAFTAHARVHLVGLHTTYHYHGLVVCTTVSRAHYTPSWLNNFSSHSHTVTLRFRCSAHGAVRFIYSSVGFWFLPHLSARSFVGCYAHHGSHAFSPRWTSHHRSAHVHRTLTPRCVHHVSQFGYLVAGSHAAHTPFAPRLLRLKGARAVYRIVLSVARQTAVTSRYRAGYTLTHVVPRLVFTRSHVSRLRSLTHIALVGHLHTIHTVCTAFTPHKFFGWFSWLPPPLHGLSLRLVCSLFSFSCIFSNSRVFGLISRLPQNSRSLFIHHFRLHAFIPSFTFVCVYPHLMVHCTLSLCRFRSFRVRFVLRLVLLRFHHRSHVTRFTVPGWFCWFSHVLATLLYGF